MSFVGKVGVPCSVLNTCKRLSHFVPMTVLGGGYYYYPHFTDEETETRRYCGFSESHGL